MLGYSVVYLYVHMRHSPGKGEQDGLARRNFLKLTGAFVFAALTLDSSTPRSKGTSPEYGKEALPPDLSIIATAELLTKPEAAKLANAIAALRDATTQQFMKSVQSAAPSQRSGTLPTNFTALQPSSSQDKTTHGVVYTGMTGHWWTASYATGPNGLIDMALTVQKSPVRYLSDVSRNDRQLRLEPVYAEDSTGLDSIGWRFGESTNEFADDPIPGWPTKQPNPDGPATTLAMLRAMKDWEETAAGLMLKYVPPVPTTN